MLSIKNTYKKNVFVQHYCSCLSWTVPNIEYITNFHNSFTIADVEQVEDSLCKLTSKIRKIEIGNPLGEVRHNSACHLLVLQRIILKISAPADSFYSSLLY